MGCTAIWWKILNCGVCQQQIVDEITVTSLIVATFQVLCVSTSMYSDVVLICILFTLYAIDKVKWWLSYGPLCSYSWLFICQPMPFVKPSKGHSCQKRFCVLKRDQLKTRDWVIYTPFLYTLSEELISLPNNSIIAIILLMKTLTFYWLMHMINIGVITPVYMTHTIKQRQCSDVHYFTHSLIALIDQFVRQRVYM